MNIKIIKTNKNLIYKSKRPIRVPVFFCESKPVRGYHRWLIIHAETGEVIDWNMSWYANEMKWIRNKIKKMKEV